MATNFTDLRAEVQAQIKPNGVGAITGQVLQDAMLNLVGATEAEMSALNAATDEKLAQLDQEFQAIKDAEFTVTPHIERVAMTETIAELQPDRFYVWEQPVESLVISKLIPADAKFVSRYQFEFVCPDNAPTALSMPVGIVWNEQPVLKPGKTYQVSITDNLAIINSEAELETILEDYVTEKELNERGFFTEEEIAALLVNKADKTYVDDAIATAITTTLNTEV